MRNRSNRRAAASGSDEQTSSENILRVLQSKEEIKAYYDKIAKVYDLLAERSEDPMRLAGLEKLDVRPNEKVLEIGFGTGHCLIELARHVVPQGHVYGVDISEEMFKLAGDLVSQEGYDDVVELWLHDAAKLPFEDEAMDAVFMSFTLELFDTPEIPTVLAECRRVLRPEGRIAVVSLSKEQSDDPMTKVFEWTHRHFPNLLDCRPIFVRRALEEAGFEIAGAEVRHMWAPVEIVLGRKPPT